MGMIRPIFRREPAPASSRNDLLLQLPKLCGHLDTGPEGSGPIEYSCAIEHDRDARRSNLRNALDHVLTGFVRALPEELERDVPRLRRTPAQSVARAAKAALHA